MPQKEIRVLVVEDVAMVSEMIRGLLEDAGYIVAGEAENGRQAVELTQALRPDVVLMDVEMPGMDGVEATRCIQECCPTPVVMLTAYETPELVKQAGAAGAGAYLVKPPNARDVERAITIAMTRFDDLMEMHRLNAQLEEQNAELRKLSQAVVQSANTIVITDLEGNIAYVNPKFAETTGYTVEEALGQNTRILKSGEQSNAYYRELWTTIKSGQEWHGEFHNKRKDGTLYWEQATIAPVYDAAGRMTHFIAVKEDITARKEAEAAVREYQRQLEASYQREQARRRLSDTLREVAKIVSSTLEQRQVLDLILAQLDKVITYHRATVLLLTGDKLSVVAGRDKMGSQIEHITIEAHKYPLNAVVLTEKHPLLLSDVTADARWHALGAMSTIRSFINAPLLAHNQPIGLLAVGRRDETPYTKDDLQTVFAFASQVAVALESARLHEYEINQVERELAIARQIQMSLLPRAAPAMPGLDIAGLSQPARLVGGDFYNYFVFAEGCLGIAVGDVSGKGVQAALMMSLSFGIVTAEMHREVAPAALLTALNQELHPHTQRNKMNTALGYVILEQLDDTWAIHAANAGLITPLVRRRDGAVAWIDVSGLPLGMMAEVEYEEIHQTLCAGDVLILSSDGIVETTNAAGELYGFQRFVACVADAPHSSAREIQEWILADVRAFAGDAEAHDDLTLIVVVIE